MGLLFIVVNCQVATRPLRFSAPFAALALSRLHSLKVRYIGLILVVVLRLLLHSLNGFVGTSRFLAGN